MRSFLALLALVLLVACGDAGVPAAPENPIEGDPLPNQGREDLDEPDPGTTLGQEVPNPQPAECNQAPAEPELSRGLIETAAETGDFDVLVDLVRGSDLEDLLETGGPYTLFAPTDAAFEALPPGLLDIFRENQGEAEQLLRNHLVQGACPPEDLREVRAVRSLADRDIAIAEQDKGFLVNEATVVAPAIDTGNGVLYGIDSVLVLPPVPGGD